MLVVVNPMAGNNDKSSIVDELTSSFENVDIMYTVGDGSDESRITSRLSEHDVVIAVGGDGTVRLVAKMLFGSKKKLGVVPAGSANGFAKEIGINGQNALAVLKREETRSIDTLYINDEPCIHLADIGFNASLMKHFNKKSFRGILGYGAALIKQAFITKSFVVEINNERFRAGQITFANGKRYGTGIPINPNGALDDGRFEIIIFNAFNKQRLLTNNEKAVINNEAKRPLQIDGEPRKTPSRLVVTIVPKNLVVIAPKK